jgi:deoxyadenosine/deoxycytidine kinase
MKKIIVFSFLMTFACNISAKTPLLFIEGNIGAGKSTLIKILKKYFPSVVLTLEPCDEWQHVQGHNLLHAFYNDPARWAPLFQIYASMTRIRKQQREALMADQLQIMERSWFSDRYCFAQMLHKAEKINDLEWAVYEQMWDWYMRNTDFPLGFIYLRVSPEECFARLQQRNRSEEAGVPLKYLQQLHACHEQLLTEKRIDDQAINFSVLVLDGSLNFRDDLVVQQDFVRQILDFLKIHGNIDLII